MKCVIGGSYRKYYDRIRDEVVPVFHGAGIDVLIPPVSKIANPGKDFPLFDADASVNGREGCPQEIIGHIKKFVRDSDIPDHLRPADPNNLDDVLVTFARLTGSDGVDGMLRALRLEGNFIETGRKCDFVYIFNPEGYIGIATSIELGTFLAQEGLPEIYSYKPIMPGGRMPYDMETLPQSTRESYAGKKEMRVLNRVILAFTPQELVEYFRAEGRL